VGEDPPRRRLPAWVGWALVGVGAVFAGLVANVALVIGFGGGAWWEAIVTLLLWGGLGLLVVRWGRRIAGPPGGGRADRRTGG
jgi:ABC-type enterobactin transport system permease subunit